MFIGNKIKKKRFKIQEKELLEILNEWDPIPGSLYDEYDCLAHEILSLLYRKSDESKLNQLILEQLVDHFGFENYNDDLEEVSKKIIKWWTDKYDA